MVCLIYGAEDQLMRGTVGGGVDVEVDQELDEWQYGIIRPFVGYTLVSTKGSGVA